MEVFMYLGLVTTLWLLFSCCSIYGTPEDVSCLRSIKASLDDPNNYLNYTWNFNNKTEGYICSFAGISCWHPDENKVLSIKLGDMGLKGEFPRGISNCTSMTALDLSNNKLNGSIPSDISKLIPFVTTLDLSFNSFSGSIPVDLANITYLNDLKLDNNRLSGQIPPEFGLLDRLKAFSVSNNLLTGQVPVFHNFKISADSYANNPGLCGTPLNACQAASSSSRVPIIAGAAIGGVILAAICVAIGICFYYRKYGVKRRKKKDEDPDGNKWAKSLKGVKGVKISMFENSVTKMRMKDLMKATNEFNKENIIGSGRTGTVYKAVLEDGTPLMVKRLQDSQRTEKEFSSEMKTLGSVKHQYARTLVATPKGDVYSFGTVLLELVTGEKPTHLSKAPETFKGNLVEWIMLLSENSQLHDAIDISLVGKGFDNEVFQALKVARNCVGLNPKERPTMFEVYQFLRAIGEPYNFTTEDEMLMPLDNGECIDELIVAMDVRVDK
ncbi:hypothetical protein ACFE04_000507 [Oxalis oulophora]